jgi:hypothetical protein
MPFDSKNNEQTPELVERTEAKDHVFFLWA